MEKKDAAVILAGFDEFGVIELAQYMEGVVVVDQVVGGTTSNNACIQQCNGSLNVQCGQMNGGACDPMNSECGVGIPSSINYGCN